MAYVVVAGRCLLVLVFAAAALGKLRPAGAFAGFRASVGAARLVPPPLLTPVAVAVPAAEAAVIPLLAVPGTARWGAAGAAVLLVGFSAVIVVSLRRAVPVQCRCFGSHGAPFAPHHLMRNAALLLACAAAAGPVPAGGPEDVAGLALSAVAALITATVVIRLDDVVSLFSSPHV